jgi:hypothetical protein
VMRNHLACRIQSHKPPIGLSVGFGVLVMAWLGALFVYKCLYKLYIDSIIRSKNAPMIQLWVVLKMVLKS